MKPSTTCHAIRSILKAVGSGIRTDHNGLYDNEPQFPDVDQDSDTFGRQYLAYNVARKRELDSPSTEEVAYRAFMLTEDRCQAIEQTGQPFANSEYQ